MADTIEKNKESVAKKESEEGKEHTLYEIAYIVDGNVPEEKSKEIAAAIRNLIEEKHHIIIEEIFPKLRKLAYAIQKKIDSYSGSIKFLGKSTELNDITAKIKKIPEILRFLVTQSYKEELTERRGKSRKKMMTEEERTRIKEIDKRLEEILGK